MIEKFEKDHPGYTLNPEMIIDKLEPFTVISSPEAMNAPPGSRYAQVDEYNPQMGVMYFNCGGYMIVPKQDDPVNQVYPEKQVEEKPATVTSARRRGRPRKNVTIGKK